MTNREKFKEEILELVCSGKGIAIHKSTNEPCNCDIINCAECTLNNMGCKPGFAVWCNAEYVDVEPCPFERDELVEVSDDGEYWQLRYFAYFDNGKFYAYVREKTSEETDTATEWIYCRKYGSLGGLC